jgi:hypothetical protein
MLRPPTSRLLRQTGAFAVGAAAILGTLFAGGVTAEQLGHVAWPWGTVLLLTLSVAALLARQRGTGVRDPADQHLLDELLGLLSRPAMRELRSYGFGNPWPVRIGYPVLVFEREYGEVEHRFGDPTLEAARVALYASAGAFLDASERNAWSFDRRTDHLYVGCVRSEIVGLPDKERLFEARCRAISTAAEALLEAHTELVRVAKARGYALDALAGARAHPTIARLDATSAERAAGLEGSAVADR